MQQMNKRTVQAPPRAPQRASRLPQWLGWSIVAVIFALSAVLAIVLSVDIGGDGAIEAGVLPADEPLAVETELPALPASQILLDRGRLADAARYEALAAAVPQNIVIGQAWQADSARLEALAAHLAPDLSDARLADSMRLQGLAELHVGRAILADAARWEALADHFAADFTRARMAEAERWEALAASMTPDLTNARLADAARWQGLADMAFADIERGRLADAARLGALAAHLAGEPESVTIHQPL